MSNTKTITILTCPKCSREQSVVMPTNACQHFYKCINCGEMLKPKEGDCCVFCSYADNRCPPKQSEELSLYKVCSQPVPVIYKKEFAFRRLFNTSSWNARILASSEL